MSSIEACPFCTPANTAELEDRTIYKNELIRSFLSNKKLVCADVHALVIPRRHIEAPYDGIDQKRVATSWWPEEILAVYQEVKRLQRRLLERYVMAPDFSKPMPRIPQGFNGTKVDHVHQHVLAGNQGELFNAGILWGSPKDFEPLPQEDVPSLLEWLAHPGPQPGSIYIA